MEPSLPKRRRVGEVEDGFHPHLRATHLNGTGRHVVRPEVEGAATREIKASVVPVAGQDAILDAAAVEWKAHVRTAIVEGENASTVIDNEDRSMGTAHDEAFFRLQLLKADAAH